MDTCLDQGRITGCRNFWLAPLAGLGILTIVFSLRLLSDPDLGFHLNAGRWIIQHRAFPINDFATYTVSDHIYIDLHWLFQVIIYGIYSLTGYHGLSFLLCILICWLFYLIGRRMTNAGVRCPVMIFLLLLALLVMEPRFILRPELVTSIFIIFYQIILDGEYREKRPSRLIFLPVIMLIWCNMEGLFMLGYALIGAYFISGWVRDRKPDLRLLGWGVATVAVCLINPYGLKGLLFPFELLTRFQQSNVFHQHIKEFQPIFQVQTWTLKEYASLIYFSVSVVGMIFTIRQRKTHEVILWIIFAILALLAIRNIPLFIIITISFTGNALDEMVSRSSKVVQGKWGKKVKLVFGVLILAFILALIPRVITNAYYSDNLSYNKTGIGLDRFQFPEGVIEFIESNHLDGRIINSLSYGGWISWRTARPIFVDARLEVIGEPLYKEIEESWNEGLPALIDKYQPDLLVYDYSRYFSWTPQLHALHGWHPIYLDGQSAIFAREGYATQIKFPDTSRLAGMSDELSGLSLESKKKLLEQKRISGFTDWLHGFYKFSSCLPQRDQNMASFFLQTENLPLAEHYFLKTLKETCCTSVSCYYALAGIYMANNNPILVSACYNQIRQFNPEDPVVHELDLSTEKNQRHPLVGSSICRNTAEAIRHFNLGNDLFKSGAIQDAIVQYNEAILLDPSYSKAYLNRGYIRATELKEFQLALSDFDSAVILDPDFAEAYLSRGSCRLAMKDLSGALEDWKKSASLGNQQALELLRKHQP